VSRRAAGIAIRPLAFRPEILGLQRPVRTRKKTFEFPQLSVGAVGFHEETIARPVNAEVTPKCVKVW